jgi:HD-GYP domain-containing protein (c-di-GMP phosphodiesterase class II)
VRIGELLGALSLATDLAAGTPLETSMRTCVLAGRLARLTGIGDPGEVRRASLLRHLGCTAYSHEAARLAAGDDHDVLNSFAGVDRGSRAAVAKRAVTRLARGAPLGRRIAAVARVMTHPGAGPALVSAQCHQAVALAEDLAMSAGVTDALAQIYERHDGRGGPHGLAGDAIAPAARVLHVAELAVTLHRTSGRDAALAELRRRRGKHLAPALVDAFVAEHASLWDLLEVPSIWERYLEEEASGAPASGPALELEAVARAFGRYADLKSPFTLGHSTAVADLAAAAAAEDRDAAARLRVAGLLHDLGAVSVPNGIWDKPSILNEIEWERVRLHAYYSERILARTPLLADAAVIAGSHHERLDGTGYHRGVGAQALEREARVLAAADAYASRLEARPHRPAHAAAGAADELAADARAGKLCRRAVDAVLGAAGHPRPARDLPAGLTAREIEVLVHLARGLTNKEIATALGIAVRTTNHHVENIYGKIDVTTRAAAALFAVRHDLI